MGQPAFPSPRCATACLIVALAGAAPAATAAENSDELALKLSNPVARLISVPFQYNADFGLGPNDDSRQILVVQPVIPFEINDNWNLITRIITPVILNTPTPSGRGTDAGLGDMTPTFFLSPAKPSANGVIWGVGPVFLLPTASDAILGSEKWGLGPSAVVLRQSGAWTYGMLVNHVWSVAGKDSRADVSNTFMQPFVSYALGQGRTVGFGSETSYNWEAPGGRRFNVPLAVNYSQIMPVGSQLISLTGGVRYYAETPGDGPDWGVRFTVTLLFPR